MHWKYSIVGCYDSMRTIGSTERFEWDEVLPYCCSIIFAIIEGFLLGVALHNTRWYDRLMPHSQMCVAGISSLKSRITVVRWPYVLFTIGSTRYHRLPCRTSILHMILLTIHKTVQFSSQNAFSLNSEGLTYNQKYVKMLQKYSIAKKSKMRSLCMFAKAVSKKSRKYMTYIR